MNRSYEDDDPPGRGYDGQRQRGLGRSDADRNGDREISLGVPAILGLFFALALVCASFFGFGYTMGRKSAQSATAPADAATSPGFSTAKPSAGSPASQPPVAPAAQPMADDSAAPTVVQPGATSVAPDDAPPSASKSVAPQADSMIVGDKPAARNLQPATNNQLPAIVPNGTVMVQVAAVSSQDVANILLASLEKKGYSVAIRHDPQDKLLHVQIGPFATRKDAEAMQQRVLADGFNAIVK